MSIARLAKARKAIGTRLGRRAFALQQAEVTADQRALNVVPALIADLGGRSRPALCRILHRQHPQPEHSARLCSGVQPVFRLV
jgi:hypothetical protein